MRLVDIDKARDEYRNLIDLTMSDTTLLQTLYGVLDNAPTVEAIPKDQYKAEMVALLTEIQVGIGEHINPSNHTDSYEDGWLEGAEWCIDYIQQKINSLRETER